MVIVMVMKRMMMMMIMMTMTMMTVPQPKVAILHSKMMQRSKAHIISTVQGCSPTPTAKTECPECDPISMINKKLEKLIKCASKEDGAEEVIDSSLFDHPSGWILKRNKMILSFKA